MANDRIFSSGIKAGTDNVPPRISPEVSLNYSVAKVLAIFTVAAGHWFTGTLLWIPVTFGLFVFAFSSAFFTSKLYGERINRGKFWRKKLERLGLRYWVILTFIAIVVAAQGKTVLHWHTLVHFTGLSGVLNWLHIPSESKLGGGLWFFTLLLVFYLAYPYLAQIARSRQLATAVSLAATVIAIYLEEHVKVGHELWLTALGFVLGVMYGAHEPRVPAWAAGLLALLGCAMLFALNTFAHYNGANTALIALTSIGISVWLAKARLPQWSLAQGIARLETYLLEIFLIHTYLFVRPTGNSGLDFVLSMGLVMVAAVVVNRVAGVVAGMVFDRAAVAPVRQHGFPLSRE